MDGSTAVCTDLHSCDRRQDRDGRISLGELLEDSQHQLFLVASLLLVVRPGASSSVLAPSSKALVTSSYLLLVVRPGQELLVASLLLVAMPFVPSSVRSLRLHRKNIELILFCLRGPEASLCTSCLAQLQTYGCHCLMHVAREECHSFATPCLSWSIMVLFLCFAAVSLVQSEDSLLRLFAEFDFDEQLSALDHYS